MVERRAVDRDRAVDRRHAGRVVGGGAGGEAHRDARGVPEVARHHRVRGGELLHRPGLLGGDEVAERLGRVARQGRRVVGEVLAHPLLEQQQPLDVGGGAGDGLVGGGADVLRQVLRHGAEPVEGRVVTRARDLDPLVVEVAQRAVDGVDAAGRADRGADEVAGGGRHLDRQVAHGGGAVGRRQPRPGQGADRDPGADVAGGDALVALGAVGQPRTGHHVRLVGGPRRAVVAVERDPAQRVGGLQVAVDREQRTHRPRQPRRHPRQRALAGAGVLRRLDVLPRVERRLPVCPRQPRPEHGAGGGGERGDDDDRGHPVQRGHGVRSPAGWPLRARPAPAARAPAPRGRRRRPPGPR